MSVGNCFHEDEYGNRCEKDAVLTDSVGDEWCEEHFPKNEEIVEDFRLPVEEPKKEEEKPNDLA